jgi:hypothetical protein
MYIKFHHSAYRYTGTRLSGIAPQEQKIRVRIPTHHYHRLISVAVSVPDEAWVTLATNDSYALGGLVLANSLRRAKTTRKIVIMVSNGITEAMRSAAFTSTSPVKEVEVE